MELHQVKVALIVCIRIHICPCTTTSSGIKDRMKTDVFRILRAFLCMLGNSDLEGGHSLDQEMKKIVWHCHLEATRQWNHTAKLMMVQFAECGHAVFRCSSPPARGDLKSKGGGRSSIHFNGSQQTVEWSLYRREFQSRPSKGTLLLKNHMIHRNCQQKQCPSWCVAMRLELPLRDLEKMPHLIWG